MEQIVIFRVQIPALQALKISENREPLNQSPWNSYVSSWSSQPSIYSKHGMTFKRLLTGAQIKPLCYLSTSQHMLKYEGDFWHVGSIKNHHADLCLNFGCNNMRDAFFAQFLDIKLREIITKLLSFFATSTNDIVRLKHLTTLQSKSGKHVS